ncbi:MAG TPA: hypothetical protein VNJ02_14350 [Vicinamibacterales bacterium]|nr:hypothetical protein [Vicinamibacterales bacterium]
MAEEQAGGEFDWVAAQSMCNTESMFTQLHAGVEKDVSSRNRLTGRDDDWRFELHADDDGFEVTRLRAGDTKVLAAVTFEQHGRRILVHGEDVEVALTVIVILDVAGHCRFVVGEAEYSDWEIRRMALEQLFFEDAGD